MNLAYFVHDLTDPAVRRRVQMLQAGGANVRLLGFRRQDQGPEEIEGAPVFDLGRTYDSRLGHRARKVAEQSLKTPAWRSRLSDVDVIMARNPETLLLAAIARRLHAPGARLVYEALDIHRVMLGDGTKSRVMRWLERKLLDQADLLVVSSPAFVSEYFEPRQGVVEGARPPVLLVENKPLELGASTPGFRFLAPGVEHGPPWRIGWFGMIRCRKSLDLLTNLAERRPDLMQVIIAGRPARTEFEDFDAQVAASAGATFHGAYTAGDLEALYGSVHFNWAIDYFEEGANSDWLLPNRIYEGGRQASPAIALAHVETGRWLKSRGLGVLMDDPAVELEAFLETLTLDRYHELKRASLSAPQDSFVAGKADCERLVQALAGGAA